MCTSTASPDDETCNAIDDDCDGLFDEDYVSERDLEGAFKRSGLFRYLATLRARQPLPMSANVGTCQWPAMEISGASPGMSANRSFDLRS